MLTGSPDPDVEFPPVGPIRTSSADSVVARFKTARAAYLANRSPTAAREFGEAAEAGLAVYEKAGVSDPTKLRPLQAARLAGRHAKLLGTWTGKSPWPYLASVGQRLVWVIDFDERTGGLQVAGIDRSNIGPRAIYRGDKVSVKDDILSFVAVSVNPHTGQLEPEQPPVPLDIITKRPIEGTPFRGGVPTTLTLQDGRLRYEAQAAGKSVTTLLDSIDAEDDRRSIVFYLKKGGDHGLEHGSGPELPTPAVDLADANVAWRRLARLASFAYYRSRNQDPLAHEALYLPYRSSHLTALTPGAYGGLTDLLTGRAPGAGVVQGRTEALLAEYESLEQSPHPYLKRSAGHALGLCRARLRLAMADEQFGNTPASSIRQFQQNVFLPAVQYQLLREADRAELQDSLQKAYPGYIVTVTDAPMSGESRQKLREFFQGAGGLMEDLKQRSVVSGLLAYADMVQVDRTTAFWRTWLLPLARRCGGPPSDKPLVTVEAVWRDLRSSQGTHKRLDHFRLSNVSGQDLTRVVVELIAENQWGEKAAHYWYLEQLEVADYVRLLPHPRWDKRRLNFTNEMTVTWSSWADQASEVSRQVKLSSPEPVANPEDWRGNYLDQDQQYQAKGEAFGAVAQSMMHLPPNPDRLRRLLREAASPGKNYVFRLQGDGQSGRTLVLRFLRFDRDLDAFEAEIRDPGTGRPFREDSPVWKGKLDPRPELGIVFGSQAGSESTWAFALVQDELPEIFYPAAGKPGAIFPARDMPLFPVRVP